MSTVHELDVEHIVTAIDRLIEENLIEPDRVGICIDRAFPYEPQRLAAALILDDVSAWPSLLPLIIQAHPATGYALDRACRHGQFGARSVVFFPGVRFIGPICPYDQKDGC